VPAATIPPGTIDARGSLIYVHCGGSGLVLTFVQLEGRKRVTAQEFANGARLAPADRFGG
jgi:methionyl-tRNA formyltransferase